MGINRLLIDNQNSGLQS